MDDNIPQSNNTNNLKTVRTYLSDMADTVRENEISVIKVALAEQNKHEREDLYRKVEGTPTKKLFWFIGGLVLIATAIYGTYFVIQKKAKENAPATIAKEESIISYDNTSNIEITDNDNLADRIKENNNLNTNSGINSISIIRDTSGVKEKLGVKDIFSKMEFTAPSSLIRSLSDSYMIGTYKKNENDSSSKIFMIFKTKDYEYTYAGMLEWESTLANDMLYLFDFNTKENKLEISARKWKDIIINNRDARVFLNEDDKPLLYYIFADKDSLVVTDSEDAIKEIMSRLIMKNIKPL